MNKMFSKFAWEDFFEWHQDKKAIKKIFELLKDIERNGQDQGIGNPEALRHELSGYFSRRITDKDRLVYKVDGETIYILSCKGHYN